MQLFQVFPCVKTVMGKKVATVDDRRRPFYSLATRKIPILLTVAKSKTKVDIYNKMKKYVSEFYMELENILTEVKAEHIKDYDPW